MPRKLHFSEVISILKEGGYSGANIEVFSSKYWVLPTEDYVYGKFRPYWLDYINRERIRWKDGQFMCRPFTTACIASIQKLFLWSNVGEEASLVFGGQIYTRDHNLAGPTSDPSGRHINCWFINEHNKVRTFEPQPVTQFQLSETELMGVTDVFA